MSIQNYYIIYKLYQNTFIPQSLIGKVIKIGSTDDLQNRSRKDQYMFLLIVELSKWANWGHMLLSNESKVKCL